VPLLVDVTNRSGRRGDKTVMRALLYLNLDGTSKRIEFKGCSNSILYDRHYDNAFTIGPYQPEFVETDR
jgi:hypothetical protein